MLTDVEIMLYQFSLSFLLQVICQQRGRVFHQGNTEEQMEARGRRLSFFIVSRCFNTLMKHETRVVDMNFSVVNNKQHY